jgi:hypothetical protein
MLLAEEGVVGDQLQAVDLAPGGLVKRFVGPDQVEPGGVATGGGDLQSIEQRPGRRLRRPVMIGMGGELGVAQQAVLHVRDQHDVGCGAIGVRTQHGRIERRREDSPEVTAELQEGLIIGLLGR